MTYPTARWFGGAASAVAVSFCAGCMVPVSVDLPQPLSDERREVIRVVHLQVAAEVGGVEIHGPPVGCWDGLKRGVGGGALCLLGGTIGLLGGLQNILYLLAVPVAPIASMDETISREKYDQLTAPIREQVATAPDTLQVAMLDSIQERAPLLVASDEASADATIVVGVSHVVFSNEHVGIAYGSPMLMFDPPLAMWIEISVSLRHGESVIHEFSFHYLSNSKPLSDWSASSAEIGGELQHAMQLAAAAAIEELFVLELTPQQSTLRASKVDDTSTRLTWGTQTSPDGASDESYEVEVWGKSGSYEERILHVQNLPSPELLIPFGLSEDLFWRVRLNFIRGDRPGLFPWCGNGAYYRKSMLLGNLQPLVAYKGLEPLTQ